jgi:hypothetical protein
MAKPDRSEIRYVVDGLLGNRPQGIGIPTGKTPGGGSPGAGG